MAESLNAEAPEEYINEMLADHIETLDRAAMATVKDDLLFFLFVKRLSRERRRLIRKELIRAARVGETPSRAKAFMREWRKLGYRERVEWVRFVDAWGEPFYHDKTLGELVRAYMMTPTIKAFAESARLSRDVAYKNVAPRLKALGVERFKHWLLI